MLMQMLKAAKLLVFFSLVFLLMNVIVSPQAAQNEPLPLPSPVGLDSFRGIEDPQLSSVIRLPILMNEDFANLDAEHWMDATLTLNREIIRRNGDFTLPVTDQRTYALSFGYISDLDLSMELKINQGTAVVGIRASGAGSYRLLINSDGRVQLNKWDEQLSVAYVQQSHFTSDTTIRLLALAGDLKVFIDGLEIISVRDENPLPYGTIYFESNQGSSYEIDDLLLMGRVAPEPLAGIDLITPLVGQLPQTQFSLDDASRAGATSRIFTSTNTTSSDIYLMDSNGANPRLFLGGRDMQSNPAYSSVSNKLVFESNHTGSHKWWVVSTVGIGIPQQLSSSGRDPSISPDGTMFAYIRGQNIYKISLSGGSESLVGNWNSTSIQISPLSVAWAATGKIIFSGGNSNTYKIFQVNPDGTGKTGIIADPDIGIWVDVNPAGGQVAFQKFLQNGTHQVCKVRIDTKVVTCIFTAPEVVHLSWAADGAGIAVSVGNTVYTLSTTGTILNQIPVTAYKVDWVSSSSFPAGPETPIYIETLTPTPIITPTNTPSAPTLPSYGIALLTDGLAWSSTEQTNILSGANRFADALSRIGANGPTNVDKFKTVMGPTITFLRLAQNQPQNSIYAVYYGTVAGECQVWDPTVAISTITVACRGSMLSSTAWSTGGIVTEEAVIHELGHVFDLRSLLQLRNTINHSDFGLMDCVGDRVMGTAAGLTWVRGERGWGSAAPNGADQQVLSRFQQNPYNQLSNVEAAADMVLNWVYRRTTDNAPTVPMPFNPTTNDNPPPNAACNTTPLPGALGFANIDRFGGVDTRLPGNVRYWWMEGMMNLILTSRNWK